MLSIYFFYLLIFTFGIVLGSFLNLVSDRILTDEPIFSGRSHCDYCKKPLKAKNLFPLFSFLLQRGKSACCAEKLSLWYPVSELLTGAAVLFAGYASKVVSSFSFPNALAFCYLAFVFCVFVVLFIIDAKHHVLPDKIVLLAILITAIFIVLLSYFDLKNYYDKLSADTLGRYLIQAGFWNQHLTLVFKRVLLIFTSPFFIALFFVALILLTKGRGMGGGDVKLGFLIGLFNGFPGNILAVFLGFLLGSIYSVVLMSFGKKKMKDTIAFGPFLIIGSLVAFIWGELLVNWYIRLF